eukprot:560411-Pelagomonas_calceolata.AAC.1
MYMQSGADDLCPAGEHARMHSSAGSALLGSALLGSALLCWGACKDAQLCWLSSTGLSSALLGSMQGCTALLALLCWAQLCSAGEHARMHSSASTKRKGRGALS